jgi:putative ABC transport system permease protein
VIGDEPDRLGEGFALGPTVIISREGLDRTGLVQPGAMVRWKYRFACPGSAMAQTPQRLADSLTHRFPAAGFEIRTRDTASPGLDLRLAHGPVSGPRGAGRAADRGDRHRQWGILLP